MANLCIVAIPASDDDIWEESSEKVPHMTFLFLGDADTNPNFEEICEQVQKYCARMEPFSIRVDHRGVLGPDKADVLFFSDDIPYPVLDFNSMLRSDVNIRSAYNSVQQYPEWNPHLTLGYPETPAKGWDGDEGEIDYITFDKIAVWNGDYSGQTFQLVEGSDDKPYPTDLAVPEAAWSEKMSDVLEHHGVKGMKWGVRRAFHVSSAKELHRQADHAERDAKSKIKDAGKYRAGAKDHEAKARSASSKAKKGFHNNSAFELHRQADHAERTAKAKTAAAKKYRAGAKDHEAKIKAVDASRKADAAKKPVNVEQKGNKKLKATGGQNHPAHKDAVTAKGLGQQAKKSGHQSLSNEELQRYANRLNLEQNVKRLEQQNKSGARRFLSGQLKSQGNQQANKAASTALTKVGQAAVKAAAAA